MYRFFILLLPIIVVGMFPGTSLGQTKTPICDYSAYKPFTFDHALLDAAVVKAVPKYPSEARALKVSGYVNVKILVNRAGRVVKACALDGHPLLKRVSEKTAFKWRFKRNFGLSHPPRKKFIQSTVVFNYTLDNQN